MYNVSCYSDTNMWSYADEDDEDDEDEWKEAMILTPKNKYHVFAPELDTTGNSKSSSPALVTSFVRPDAQEKKIGCSHATN